MRATTLASGNTMNTAMASGTDALSRNFITQPH
jgi:hypothetical protein